MLLLVIKSNAQDTIPVPQDSLYREDQLYLGVTYNFINSLPGDVEIRGFSGGIHFGFLRDMPVNKQRNIAIAVGAGLAFDRFGQNLFIGEDADETTIFSILTDEIDYNANRFSTAAIEAPVEFRWRTSTITSYRFWRIHAGFRISYVYWYRASFKQEGNVVFQTDIPEFDRIRYGLTLSFGYNTFNFYGYYGLNPFFKDAISEGGEDVEFGTLKVGLIFYIL
jgi:hypothetical protein